MRSSTHTEVYRPFTGELIKKPRRSLILARSGVRIAFKRKLPALILYVPVAIATIAMCVFVNTRFQLNQSMGIEANSPEAMMARAQSTALVTFDPNEE